MPNSNPIEEDSTPQPPSVPGEPAPVQPEPEALRKQRELQGHYAILSRLVESLRYGVELMKKPVKQKYYVVDIFDDAPPAVHEFTKIDSVCNHIVGIREIARQHPDRNIYLQVFCGNWLQLQKGRRWKLFDGKELIDIEGSDVGGLDPTGAMTDPAGDMVQVDPEEAITPETPLEEAPQEPPARELDMEMPAHAAPDSVTQSPSASPASMED